MDRQELSRLLERACEIDHDHFRSFSLHDCLGLTGFSEAEVEELDQAWLAFENGDFAAWLEAYDVMLYQKYRQQLDTIQRALVEYAGITEFSGIVSLRHAHETLAE
jgi:hypothetical protein